MHDVRATPHDNVKAHTIWTEGVEQNCDDAYREHG